MKRVFNFSPGPSMLPLSVLEEAASAMCDHNGSGQSVMEMSHRSKGFKLIIEETESLLRALMGIPDNYKVLFLQGGASLQFSMVPLNLAAPASVGGENGAPKKKVLLADTGIWADKAAKEASKYADVNIIASSKEKAYTYIPDMPALDSAAKEAAYCHITWNNTIVGTRWPSVPETGGIPLVTDLSSAILSEPFDVSRFALVYAGAQKNLGPAGCTVVIIRDDLLDKAPGWVPAMLRYDIHAKEGSMYNTPPCWSIYIIGLVLRWLKQNGGIEAMAKINREKAALLYDYLESSKHFYSPVRKDSRSLMNIPFVFRDGEKPRSAEEKTALEKRFVAEAAEANLLNLAGHRLVGGMRASIYNAMPVDGVKELVKFMEHFEKEL